MAGLLNSIYASVKLLFETESNRLTRGTAQLCAGTTLFSARYSLELSQRKCIITQQSWDEDFGADKGGSAFETSANKLWDQINKGVRVQAIARRF